MNDRLSEFWHATWSAWRSGVLSPISAYYAEAAAGGYDDFIKRGVNGPLLATFFTEHPPLRGEFLIGNTSGLTMVITSQRLWMFNKDTMEYVFFEIAHLAQLESMLDGSLFHVNIQMKDGKQYKYEKMVSVPSHEAVTLAMHLSIRPDDWSTVIPRTGDDHLMPKKKKAIISNDNEKFIKKLDGILKKLAPEDEIKTFGIALWDTRSSKALSLLYLWVGRALLGILGDILHNKTRTIGIIGVSQRGYLYTGHISEGNLNECDTLGSSYLLSSHLSKWSVTKSHINELSASIVNGKLSLTLPTNVNITAWFPPCTFLENNSVSRKILTIINHSKESGKSGDI